MQLIQTATLPDIIENHRPDVYWDFQGAEWNFDLEDPYTIRQWNNHTRTFYSEIESGYMMWYPRCK